MSIDRTSDPLDDLFSGSGAPAFKFDQIGDSVTGVITSLDVRQQTDFESGELKFWDDGKAMMEVVITLATALRDPNVDDDEGERRVFCRGAMLTALKGAVHKVKAQKPAIGGRVTITYSDLGEVKKRGFNAPKLYTVAYEAPSDVAVAEVFADEPAVPEPTSQEALLAKAKDMDPAELAALIAASTK